MLDKQHADAVMNFLLRLACQVKILIYVSEFSPRIKGRAVKWSPCYQIFINLSTTVRDLETRLFTSRRTQLCTNQVPSRSMQKPLRLSRDTDGRTDGFSALYSRCTYV